MITRLLRSLPGFLLGAALTLLATGCGTAPHKFRLEAFAINRAGEVPRQYTITSTMPGISPSDPRFQEVADEIRFALNAQGMVEAHNPTDADIEVTVAYGLGAQRTITKESTETVYAMGQLETVHGTIATPTGIATTRQSVYTPTQTMDATRVETSVVTEKHLTIIAQETTPPARGAQPRQIWSVQVSSLDPDADLFVIAPLMASAAGDYLGTNTDGRREVVVQAPAK